MVWCEIGCFGLAHTVRWETGWVGGGEGLSQDLMWWEIG